MPTQLTLEPLNIFKDIKETLLLQMTVWLNNISSKTN